MSTLPNRCLSSTTFDVETVTIRRPRRGEVTGGGPGSAGPTAAGGNAGRARAKALRAWRFATRLDWRKPIAVHLSYELRPDPVVVVRARGHVQRYPWDTAILDILSDIANR